MLLTDKVAIVTGANGGIGRAICKVFLENGAKVIGMLHVNQEGLEENVQYIKFDVTSSASCEHAVQQVKDITDRIDMLCIGGGMGCSTIIKRIGA